MNAAAKAVKTAGLGLLVAGLTAAAACRESDRSLAPADPPVASPAVARDAAPLAVPPAAPKPAAAPLTDLTTSLEAIRAEFNAHRGEKRFLTLLAPT